MRGAYRTVRALVARGYSLGRAVALAAAVHGLSPERTTILTRIAGVP